LTDLNPVRPPFAIFRPKEDLAKDQKRINKKIEPNLKEIRFTVHKLNNRPKPTKRERIKIISCFSEFGCETIGCMYCIPRLLKRFPGQYVIAMGWYGREYLYRHLVDEYWEIDEEFMWLRDYTRAFNHVSYNLKRLEEAATQYGDVVPTIALGKYAISNMCRTCGKFWQEWKKQADMCPACKSTVLTRSIFTDIKNYKAQARKIPSPKKDLLKWASDLLKPYSVGIFARARKTYGRNLPASFYVKLISLLEGKGYNVVWLGEKQNTLECPVDHILDFTKMPESRDLEKTLSIISNLNFTIQFWTASTRLAGAMGCPFLLFESPEQIYASSSGLMAAQEGKRLELSSFGPKKVVVSHYHTVMEKQDEALDIVKSAIEEMEQDNWEDIIGLVENEEFSKKMKDEFYEMLT
jgi:hypothetical protein